MLGSRTVLRQVVEFHCAPDATWLCAKMSDFSYVGQSEGPIPRMQTRETAVFLRVLVVRFNLFCQLKHVVYWSSGQAEVKYTTREYEI